VLQPPLQDQPEALRSSFEPSRHQTKTITIQIVYTKPSINPPGADFEINWNRNSIDMHGATIQSVEQYLSEEQDEAADNRPITHPPNYQEENDEVIENVPPPIGQSGVEQNDLENIVKIIRDLGDCKKHDQVPIELIQWVLNVIRDQTIMYPDNELNGKMVQIKNCRPKTQANDDTTNKRYKCRICEAENKTSLFKNDNARMKHQRTHFYMILNDPCPHCKERFPRTDNHKTKCEKKRNSNKRRGSDLMHAHGHPQSKKRR